MSKRATRLGSRAPLVLIWMALLSSGAVSEESRVGIPTLPPAMGPECVEPADIMRRQHMTFLLEQRDETVIRGVRNGRHSLVGCIDCHAQRDAAGQPVPVNAPGQFCEACHRYAGVRMDCFECHAAVPANSASRPAYHGEDAYASRDVASTIPDWAFVRRPLPVSYSVLFGEVNR